MSGGKETLVRAVLHVFTIGFQVPNGDKPGLRSCASNASKFYDAADAATLRAAFRAIAEEINNLRISS